MKIFPYIFYDIIYIYVNVNYIQIFKLVYGCFVNKDKKTDFLVKKNKQIRENIKKINIKLSLLCFVSG